MRRGGRRRRSVSFQQGRRAFPGQTNLLGSRSRGMVGLELGQQEIGESVDGSQQIIHVVNQTKRSSLADCARRRIFEHVGTPVDPGQRPLEHMNLIRTGGRKQAEHLMSALSQQLQQRGFVQLHHDADDGGCGRDGVKRAQLMPRRRVIREDQIDAVGAEMGQRIGDGVYGEDLQRSNHVCAHPGLERFGEGRV